MQKVLGSLMILLLAGVFMIMGCGGGDKYKDVNTVLDTEIDVMSTFVADMENAGNADAVVAAIHKYTSGMEKLIPQLKDIAEKYPNIKTQTDISDDLKAKLNRVGELAGQFQASIMKASGYMMNPKVQKAWEDFGTVMNKQQGIQP